MLKEIKHGLLTRDVPPAWQFGAVYQFLPVIKKSTVRNITYDFGLESVFLNGLRVLK